MKAKNNHINIDKFLDIDNVFKTEKKRNLNISRTNIRVTCFRKHWISIVSECGNMSEGLTVQETKIQYHMEKMIYMLINEDRNLHNNLANCGSCMEYFLSKDCLCQLVESSIKKIPPNGLIYATIDFYSKLCSFLNENFLTKKTVYKPLLKLLKYCYSNERITEKGNKCIIDLLFNICQKINLYPQLLNIFINEGDNYYECILFEYLKKFIFNFGQTGEMAITAMKYLFVHPLEIFLNYINFIKFPEQLVYDLVKAFNNLPLNINEIDDKNIYIYRFKTIFSIIESIIMDCSIQSIRNSIMFNFKKKFLQQTFIRKYIKNYESSKALEVISTYLYYMLSKIVCIDFSSCFISFIFEPFEFSNDDNAGDRNIKETNLFNLIIDNIMNNKRDSSLAAINMLIISCMLKQHYRYTISYLIPNIRTKINQCEIQYNGKEIINEIRKDSGRCLRNEVNRYIDLFNTIKEDFGNDNSDISNQLQEYIFDANTNSDIQLSGLNFNEINKNYPENIIQEMPEEPDELKAIKLLDKENIFKVLFSLLKSFFDNSPDFNLALTDAISQLLTAPETYIFIYLVDRDLLENYNKDSLYTIFIDLIKKRQDLLRIYQNKYSLFNFSDKYNSLHQKNQDLLISNFNKNSRFMFEFIKEVTITIFEIQLKSEIFENY
ncbi:hypothetical protein BCR36DRAFT_315125, partial [Piromyces finnis]